MSDPLQQRHIRVFISSTFRDMQAERDELIKYVFPKLRQFCEPRSVSLGEVDLRWGITDEASAEGKVLPICLAEIDHCCPYFISLLGNRYGWIPDEIPQDLRVAHPWLEQHLEKSITELEILHGALNHREAPPQVFFYFREPQDLGATDTRFGEEDIPSSRKLEALKQEVRHSGFSVRAYARPEEVGQMIFDDFKRLIEQLFPEETGLSPFERENAAHQAFIDSRSRFYVSRSRDFKRLDRFAEGKGGPLVITGFSGVGKSALLANWVRHRRSGAETAPASLRKRLRKAVSWLAGSSGSRTRPSEPFIVTHFIGATAQSTDWPAMLRRIMMCLKEPFDVALEIPDQPVAVSGAFASWLHRVAEKGKLILVIDGLEQIEQAEQTADLSWLPETIPENIRLILSTDQEATLEEARRRGWFIMDVHPLRPKERGVFINDYLRQYRKALSPALSKPIVEAPKADSPLYLRTLLEELRQFGQHEKLRSQIQHYSDADSVQALFVKVLNRLEADYERPRPGLVRDAMRLLVTARQGLSETELLDLLGEAAAPLPGAVWSPLYLAIRESLVVRSGLLTFFHPGLRQAVLRHYVPGTRQKQETHRALADYFAARPLAVRALDELPWHLAALQDWERLYTFLADPAFLRVAWPTHSFDIRAYWALIERHTGLRMVEAYRPLLDAPAAHPGCAWPLALLLRDAGYTEEALQLGAALEHLARQSHNTDDLQASLSMQATLLKRRGELTRALALLQEQETLCRQRDHRAALAACLGNQGVLFRDKGQTDEALRCFAEEEQLCRSLGDYAGLSMNQGNLGIMRFEQGALDEALVLFREQGTLCRLLGDQSGLQKSLGHQGLLYRRKGDDPRALALYAEAEAICRRLGDEAGLQTHLGYHAQIAQDQSNYDRAMDLLDEKVRLCRRLGDPAALALSLAQQADLFAGKLRQPAYALPFAEEAYDLALRYGFTKLAQDIKPRLDAIRTQVSS